MEEEVWRAMEQQDFPSTKHHPDFQQQPFLYTFQRRAFNMTSKVPISIQMDTESSMSHDQYGKIFELEIQPWNESKSQESHL
jgi:hypothetical protein